VINSVTPKFLGGRGRKERSQKGVEDKGGDRRAWYRKKKKKKNGGKVQKNPRLFWRGGTPNSEVIPAKEGDRVMNVKFHCRKKRHF